MVLSLGYYRRVAGSVEPYRIFEALSFVKLASREGRIATGRGALFVHRYQIMALWHAG
jgi:hypothetical protein